MRRDCAGVLGGFPLTRVVCLTNDILAKTAPPKAALCAVGGAFISWDGGGVLPGTFSLSQSAGGAPPE